MGRTARALGAALLLHALFALALALLPAPPRVALHARVAIEVDWRALPPAPMHAIATPAPVVLAATTHRPRATHAAPPSAALASRAPASPPSPSPAAPSPGASELAPPSTGASDPAPPSPRGPVELFPRALLDGLAQPPPAPDDRSRDTPQGWLDDAAAEARTRAGGVAPVWRQVERALADGFAPPVSVVHDKPSGFVRGLGDHLRTLYQQGAAVVRDESRLRHPVEPGSTLTEAPMGHSIDPSQQTFLGVPEGLNLRTMPLEQQQAAAAAFGEPASWLRVEVEIAVDATGTIARARVAVPSGRRAFDRFALAAVKDAVARAAAAAPSTRSRWICEAGYAVDRVDQLAVQFDLSMLFDKRLRRQLAVRHPLGERVDHRVSLKWVEPLR